MSETPSKGSRETTSTNIRSQPTNVGPLSRRKELDLPEGLPVCLGDDELFAESTSFRRKECQLQAIGDALPPFDRPATKGDQLGQKNLSTIRRR
jgi:hypothetical protein